MKFFVLPVWLDRECLKKGLLIPLLFALLVPPICSCILNYEFREQRMNHIPTAIVDHDNSALSRSLVDKIRTNEVFDVNNYGGNDQEVKNWIDAGEAVAGIIIPEHFAADLLDGQAPRVLIVYDGSQMGAAGSARNRIAEIMATIRCGYLMEVMEGQLDLTPEEAEKFVQPVAFTTRFLGNPVKSLAYFFLQGLILGIAQVAVFILGVESYFARPQTFLQHVLNTIFCGFAGLVSAAVSLGIQVFWFNSPFTGSVTAALLLTFLNMTGIAGLGILFGMILNDKLNAISGGSVIMATVLFSGYTFPALSMPEFFQRIAAILPFTHYGIPMRDVTLLGSNLSRTVPDIGWLACFVLAGWLAILCGKWAVEWRRRADEAIAADRREVPES